MPWYFFCEIENIDHQLSIVMQGFYNNIHPLYEGTLSKFRNKNLIPLLIMVSYVSHWNNSDYILAKILFFPQLSSLILSLSLTSLSFTFVTKNSLISSSTRPRWSIPNNKWLDVSPVLLLIVLFKVYSIWGSTLLSFLFIH